MRLPDSIEAALETERQLWAMLIVFNPIHDWTLELSRRLARSDSVVWC